MAPSAICTHNYRGWGRGAATHPGFQKVLGTLADAFGASAPGSDRDRQICPLVWEGRTYYVKYYCSPTLKSHLQSLLGWSKAHNAQRCARRLGQVGIATPRVLAHLQRGRLWNPPEHLLVTEGIDGDTLRVALQTPLSTPHRRALVQSLAAFLARLHDAGVYHGDFSAFNIIVQAKDQTPPNWQIYLIDLDAVRSLHYISRRRQIKNLDELGRSFPHLKAVSIQDRMRFLHHYAQARHGRRLPLRQLKERVCRRTTQRMQSYGKRFITS